MSTYSSKLVENAVNELAKLPGIGRKTALRLALHLLKQDKPDVELLGNSVIKMRNDVIFCKKCHNISDSELCSICSSPRRNGSVICVVEDIRDVMAIENTSQFNGLYHVLGGIISPLDGIGPNDLTIDKLANRLKTNEVVEIILALSATIEGDTTNFYLYKRLAEFDVLITTIARGVSVGDELEYTDEITLGRSILNRQPFEGLNKKSQLSDFSNPLSYFSLSGSAAISNSGSSKRSSWLGVVKSGGLSSSFRVRYA